MGVYIEYLSKEEKMYYYVIFIKKLKIMCQTTKNMKNYFIFGKISKPFKILIFIP
jgi:hypothetical protein